MTGGQQRSLADVLEDRASKQPGRTLFEFLDTDLEVRERLTFSDLLLRAQSIAARLESAGLRGRTAPRRSSGAFWPA
jgi:acyl-CoA synthetase (AMP-forming)/AMP-acid ligase II